MCIRDRGPAGAVPDRLVCGELAHPDADHPYHSHRQAAVLRKPGERAGDCDQSYHRRGRYRPSVLVVWRRFGLRAAAAELLNLPRPDSAKLCHLDASREDLVYAPVRTELNNGCSMSHSLLSDVLVWVGIAFCITQAAIFSGLNLAIFSISKLRLEVAAAGGNRDALELLALRKDSNLSLIHI